MKIFYVFFLFFILISCSVVQKLNFSEDAEFKTDKEIATEDQNNVILKKINFPNTIEFDKDGKPIGLLKDNTKQIATASYEDGEPVIKYNEDFLVNFPEEIQWFIFFHEVGHFKNGDNFLNLSETQRRALQVRADVYALERLEKDYGFTKEKIQTIYDFTEKYLGGAWRVTAIKAIRGEL